MTSALVAELLADATSLDRVELAALISDLLDLQARRAVAEARADIDAHPIEHEAGVA